MGLEDQTPHCKCGTPIQWDDCHYRYWDPFNGCYHSEFLTSHEGSTKACTCSMHVCWRCGEEISIICDCGFQEDQPQLKDVKWDEPPNYVISHC